MKLRVKNGQLSYGSTYRFFVTSWVLGVGSLFLAMFALTFLLMLATGTGQVNGQTVTGRGALIVSMLPMVIIFPIVMLIQGFMFGGVLLFGSWLYRKFRKIEIVTDEGV